MDETVTVTPPERIVELAEAITTLRLLILYEHFTGEAMKTGVPVRLETPSLPGWRCTLNSQLLQTVIQQYVLELMAKLRDANVDVSSIIATLDAEITALIAKRAGKQQDQVAEE